MGKMRRQRTQSPPNDWSHHVFNQTKRVNIPLVATQDSTHLCWMQEVKRALNYRYFAFKFHVSVLLLSVIHFLKQSNKQPSLLQWLFVQIILEFWFYISSNNTLVLSVPNPFNWTHVNHKSASFKMMHQQDIKQKVIFAVCCLPVYSNPETAVCWVWLWSVFHRDLWPLTNILVLGIKSERVPLMSDLWSQWNTATGVVFFSSPQQKIPLSCPFTPSFGPQ